MRQRRRRRRRHAGGGRRNGTTSLGNRFLLGAEWMITSYENPFLLLLFTTTFSSVRGGICALQKSHTRSTPSLRSFPSVAFETVPMFNWLLMALSRPFMEYRRTLLLSVPLLQAIMVWCPSFCASRYCLKLLNTSDLPRRKPLVMAALPATVSFFLYSVMSRAVHPQEVSKVDVEHSHMPVWASYSTFHFLQQAHLNCEDDDKRQKQKAIPLCVQTLLIV